MSLGFWKPKLTRNWGVFLYKEAPQSWRRKRIPKLRKRRCGYDTGLRVGEAIALDVELLDLDDQEIGLPAQGVFPATN